MELVIVIAIIAVLASIAIPVVSYNIRTSTISKSKTNAHTIEQSIKEAQALVSAKELTKYSSVAASDIKIADVASVNGIQDAFKPSKMFSDTYYPVWCKGNVYFALDTNGDGVYNTGDKDIDGNSLPGNATKLYNESTGSIADCKIYSLS